MPDKVIITLPDGKCITCNSPILASVGGEEPALPRIARTIGVHNLGDGRYRVMFDDATGYIGMLSDTVLSDAINSGWDGKPLLITGPGEWRLAEPHEIEAYAKQ
jgi:hypothetical protein